MAIANLFLSSMLKIIWIFTDHVQGRKVMFSVVCVSLFRGRGITGTYPFSQVVRDLSPPRTTPTPTHPCVSLVGDSPFPFPTLPPEQFGRNLTCHTPPLCQFGRIITLPCPPTSSHPIPTLPHPVPQVRLVGDLLLPFPTLPPDQFGRDLPSHTPPLPYPSPQITFVGDLALPFLSPVQVGRKTKEEESQEGSVREEAPLCPFTWLGISLE